MAADTFACISQYVALATGDCDVLADGVVVGRVALGHHEDRTPTHGYAETRESAMAAFAKSWRYESRQRRVNRAETITMAPSGTSCG